MTAYLIKYQIRRRGGISIHQGDWQDKEVMVVAGDDARRALDEVVNAVQDQDFRLREIKVCMQVDMIAKELR